MTTTLSDFVKAYDVRGLVPQQLNIDVAHALGAAFAEVVALEEGELSRTLVSHPGVDRLVLTGPNGAGKSTAFNITLGLLTPDAGRVEIQGAPFSRRSLAQVGASINGPALCERKIGRLAHGLAGVGRQARRLIDAAVCVLCKRAHHRVRDPA